MYEYLISQYIKNLTTKDIIQYAKEKGVQISMQDAQLLLDTAQKKWKVFYKGNPESIIAALKGKLEPATYQLGIDLWKEYQNKITDNHP